MSGSLSVFVPLVKIDEERRLIIARAAQELVDKSNEIMDYESAKPEFEAWSADYHRMSNGLSKGNVRVMHTRTVAGKLTDLGFDDDAKAVDIVMKIEDDQEWRKAKSGCYTGVSIGGGYRKKWKDPTGAMRYTPRISEISLVDSPCIPTALFAELVKADGLVEHVRLGRPPRSFAELHAARPRTFAELHAARPRTFGDLQKGIWGTLGSMALGAAGIVDPELGLADGAASLLGRAGAALSDGGGAVASAVGRGLSAAGDGLSSFASSAIPKVGSAISDGVSAARTAFGAAKAPASSFASRLAAGSRRLASNPRTKNALLAASGVATAADMTAAGINLNHAMKPPKPAVIRIQAPAPPSPSTQAGLAPMPKMPAMPKVAPLPRAPRIGGAA